MQLYIVTWGSHSRKVYAANEADARAKVCEQIGGECQKFPKRHKWVIEEIELPGEPEPDPEPEPPAA